MINLAKGRILIVDDDAALLGLLQTLLEEAGCAVETIQGAEGFTPQLMALSRPALVLLNPTVGGFSRGLLRAVVKDFRRASRAPVVLFADLEEGELATQTAELGADGYVPIRTLLDDPASQLLGGQTGLVPPPPPARFTPGKKVTELSADDILGIDLGPLEPTPQPLRPTEVRPPQSSGSNPSSLAKQLFSAIEDEISTIDIVEGVEHYDVPLDVMSEGNFYSNAQGQVLGVFVPSSVPPEEGVTVELTLKFPWGGETTCEGKVEWNRSVSYLGRRNKGGFGTRLATLTKEQVAMIQRFLRLRAPIQAPPPKKA